MLRRNEKGQVSIAVGLLTVTLLFLLGFVVNLGMLVNAKINLQNAADLAAYAGASSQARMLNNISYLNYEMRREWKKFVFRYYVLGNLSQRPFPRTASGSRAPYEFSPDGTTQYGTPVICATFNMNDNFCQIAELRRIEVGNTNPIDAVSAVATGQIRAIEAARQLSCQNIGVLQQLLGIFWMMNTDPDLSQITAQFSGSETDARIRGAISLLRGLASGLGVVPRLTLLRKRIDTLEKFVNEPARPSVTLGDMTALQTGPEAPKNERTVLAFLSAFNTLGPSFEDDSIEMTELMQAPLLRLEEQRVGFSVFPVTMHVSTGDDRASTAGTEGRGNCVNYPIPYNLQSVPVAVWKKPEALTYYAVRVKAKVRLLFNPFGEMELSAYSAAQPFGSRIGPKTTESDWLTPRGNVRACQLGGAGAGSAPIADGVNRTCMPNVPGVAILEGGTSADWKQQGVLGSFFTMFNSFGTQPGGAGNSAISGAMIRHGFSMAMAPSPWERGKYNIPGSPEDDDPFVQFFDPRTQRMSIFAPLFTGTNQSEIDQEINAMIRQFASMDIKYMSQTSRDALVNSLGAGFRGYLSRLSSPVGGENGENTLFYRISNPYREVAQTQGQQVPVLSGGSPELVMLDPRRAKTSWSDVKGAFYRGAGRSGYSVKYVSFRTLMEPSGVTSDGATAWQNRPIVDSESGEVYDKIQH